MNKALYIFVISALALVSATAQETGKKKITNDSFKLPQWGGYRLSPDNSRVAFTKRERDEEGELTPAHIFVYDLSTRRTMQLTNSDKGESGIQWLSDNEILFRSDRDGDSKWWTISLYGGEGVALFDDEDARNSGTLSKDRTKVVYNKRTERPDKEEWDKKVENKDDGYYADLPADTFNHIWVYDSETKEHKQITEGEFSNTGGAWSQDGEWIAFTSNRTGTRTNDPHPSNDANIWIVSAAGGSPRQLTNNPGPDRGPAFSPDGGLLAYTGSVHENSNADQSDVWVIPFGGGTPTNLTENFDYSVSGPFWSPDGTTLFFSASKGLSGHLYRVSPDGGPISMVLPDNEYVYGGTSLSEDGTKWIFTGSSLYETAEVFLADADGGNIRNILSPNNHLGEFEIARSETLTWKGADDWNIEGIITYPLGYEEGRRYPLILQIHGGPHGRYSKSFNAGSQIWAAREYAVLRSNPRGSSGRTYEFSNANVMDWGGKDFIDIMKGVDHVIEMGVVDPEMMVVMGGSYGGFMTFWTVTQTNRFKAAIGHAGISDWYSFFGQTDIPNLLNYGFGGLPTYQKETYEKYSPIEYAANVTTPLLITHGEGDRRVPISQAEQYFVTLRKLGRDVKFLRYPREGHGIREEAHRKHLEQEQVKWFKKYLFPAITSEGTKSGSGGGSPDRR
jgi:dipeptidyl aminopeptidase/acylaminoacyl peptidase